MIRIAHILTSFDIGGAEQFALDLCRRLDRKRFEVIVVGVVRGGPLRAEFHEAGIPTEVIGKESRLGLRTIQRLTAFLVAWKPTIVHTQLFGGDTWGRIAAIRARVPHLLSTEQNMNLDEGYVKRWVKRMLARRTDRIVTIADAVRSYSMFVDRIPRDKLLVIPNGVDLAHFRPAPRTPHDGTRFLTVARCVPQKGLDVLLDAFIILRDALPHATLTIVGDGPLRPSLEAHARMFHVEDRVRFEGFRRDLLTYYHRSDVAVFPSRWEGLCIAAMESSATGLPVIASAVGGLQEVVRDQETGLLVLPDDPKVLADAMRELAGDRPQQLLFGHAGRRHIERHFAIEHVVERYTELYERTVHHA